MAGIYLDLIWLENLLEIRAHLRVFESDGGENMNVLFLKKG